MNKYSVYTAFQEQLQTLCLKEFPCGFGSWNKTHFDSGTCSGSTVPLLEDPALGAEEEEPASLIEYLSSVHSPWHLSESWGPAADQLRELAVRSPALIDMAFILSYFRSLRIVDKGVLEIGEDLLKFVNLDELILSANYITEINSTHLPRTLKVLELCANEISSMKGISCSPPAGLTHLGLGYNKLSSPSEYKYLEASFWPVLLSLDLSFNNLVDLPDLVCKLSSLSRLRTLVLMGNPLALTPSYRGFLVDSLPKLALLDDVRVLPDERHHFKGLAKRKELIVDEAKVIVSIGTVQGIPNPVNPVETETPPEYPIVSYSYHVTYEFLNDHPLSTTDEETADQAKKTPTCCDFERTNNSVQSSQQHQESTHEESRNPSADTAPPAGNMTPGPPQNKVPEDDSSVLLHCTPKVPWAGQIESEYRKVHLQRDLRSLKQFLLRGMQVSVVEQKVLSWPAITTESVSAKADIKGGAKADKGKEKGKKKKEPVALRHDAPICRTLGSLRVKLESLLLGENHLESLCDFGVLITEQAAKALPGKEAKKGKDDKKKEEKKGKTGRDSVASQKTTTSTKGVHFLMHFKSHHIHKKG
ncbi:leucine-rich repeat-containing protein 43-like isoform X3 [Acipenser ruthenus]|uniref:leucine-rich repeat-containing protein 43-like isoform X3 n=1 Tax=Acipenser ruthenus TaxID=7906 RepID=UPI002740B35D|nr:leucine-rich repeat-containing protein 43-like isoform X3 [Acipenser ruthenus]